jgi:hypothetical protein
MWPTESAQLFPSGLSLSKVTNLPRKSSVLRSTRTAGHPVKRRDLHTAAGISPLHRKETCTPTDVAPLWRPQGRQEGAEMMLRVVGNRLTLPYFLKSMYFL